MNRREIDVDPTRLRNALMRANAQALAVRAARVRAADVGRACALQAEARRIMADADRMAS